MKRTSTILIVIVSLFIWGCSNDKAPQRPQQVVPPSNQQATPTTNPNTTVPPASATNAAGEYHYICPNGADHGGSANGGACPTCGTALVHNQAYHNNVQNPAANTQAQTPQPGAATNAAGVYHYICPNGDPGGSANGGTCSVCGATLTHNQAFHANNTTTTPSVNTPSSNSGAISPIIQSQPQAPSVNVPQTPGTATNAAGEYHYICSNGCSGGSGSSGQCSKCGAQLAHNQAYHN